MTILPGDITELEHWADSRQNFDIRPDIGVMTGIAERLLRYIGGDPVLYVSVTSANFSTPKTLPNEPRARLAVCQVLVNPCFYRTDGTIPATSNEQTLQVGDIIRLYGQPTIQGFIFQAVSISACILAVNFYD